MPSIEAVHLALLCLSVVPLPPLPWWDGELAGEPVDLLLLNGKIAAFCKVGKQPYFCP